MNWKKYRKYLALVGAVLVSAGLVVLIALHAPRCAAPATAPNDAAPVVRVAPDRPERPPEERPGPGDIALAGGVFDASGAPVAGAEVSAHFELGPGVDSLAPRAAAEGIGAAPARRDGGVGDGGVGLDTMPVVVAASGEDGSFALRGLLPGRYRLRVEGPDIFTSEVRFFDVPADGVRLVVARKVAISGQVVLADGSPVSGARVGLESDTQGQVFMDSDANGRFSFTELQEGVMKVWAGHGDMAARARRVPRLGQGPFSDVVLTLEPGAVVAGRVIDRVSERGLAAFVKLTATDSEEPTRYAQSAPDGVFRIEGLPAGRYSAEAAAPGYVATEAIEFQANGLFAPTIALTPGARLAGRVVDHRGVPVPGAVISVRGVDGRGVWQMVSEHSEAQRLARARGALTPFGQASTPDARFIPRGELGVLLGPIPYPPPKGAAALRIARALEDGAGAAKGPDSDALPMAPELESSFVTDRDGRFRITGMAAGTYRLVATHAAYADAVGDRISLGLGEARDGLELVMRPGVMLVGQVTNTSGELVVGAAIIVEPSTRNKGGKSKAASGVAEMRRLDPKRKDADALIEESLRVQAVTGSDGRYQLGPIAVDAEVRVTAVRHGDAERRIELGALDDQGASPIERVEDFVLPVADAVLIGRVRDPVNFPVRQAELVIERMASPKRPGQPATWSDKWPEKWVRTGATDADGGFTIPDLAPGRYRVTVNHPDFPAFSTELGTRVTSADAAHEITLPFGGGIEGEVRDAHNRSALPGARIVATGPGGARVETAALEDGRVAMVPLAAGAWQLSLSTPGYVARELRVDVARGNEPRAITVRDLRLELERGATIAGTVRDHHGVRVHGAQVSVGPGQENSATTDEEGGFRMRDVPTGTVEIRARKGATTGAITLSLAPGDELVTLEIQLAEPAGSGDGAGAGDGDGDADQDDGDGQGQGQGSDDAG